MITRNWDQIRAEGIAPKWLLEYLWFFGQITAIKNQEVIFTPLANNILVQSILWNFSDIFSLQKLGLGGKLNLERARFELAENYAWLGAQHKVISCSSDYFRNGSIDQFLFW